MAFRAGRPAFAATSAEVNRVAIISAQEIADPAPNKLCLLKRKVRQFDQLEVSNNASWQTKVAAISKPEYRRMFKGANHDRLRFRYLVYGWEDARITLVLADLTTAFTT